MGGLDSCNWATIKDYTAPERTIKCIVGRVARIAKAVPHLPLRHLHLHLREIATQFQLLLLMIGANRIVPWDSAQQICVSAKSTSGFHSEWFFWHLGSAEMQLAGE